MYKVTKAIVSLMLASSLNLAVAFAEEKQDFNGSSLMSYAPPSQFDNQRFGQFDFGYSADEHDGDHELNDAWLGISAYSENGEYVGYIEDVVLDEDGNVTELVIAAPGQDIAVQLEVQHASFVDDKVNLKLSSNEFASIISGGQIVASLN